MMQLSEVATSATQALHKKFKSEAMKLSSQPGASKSAIAKLRGFGANLLSPLAREQDCEIANICSSKSDGVSKFENMRRELAKVKMERDILKKLSATSRRLQVRYGMIARLSQRPSSIRLNGSSIANADTQPSAISALRNFKN